MEEESIEKTCFCTPFGIFDFLVLPFGIANAPATFVRTLGKLFEKVPPDHVCIYLDDVCAMGKTEEDHLNIIRQVFEILWENNLKIKASKCNLFQDEVIFLGHRISALGLATDDKKIHAIVNFPTPTNKKAVRQAIGLFSYYRKVIFI